MKHPLMGLVDFETADKNLEDLIIQRYEGRLRENQHSVEKDASGEKVYRFRYLSTIYMLKFIGQFCEDKTYTLRKSLDGTILLQQRIESVPRHTAN